MRAFSQKIRQRTNRTMRGVTSRHIFITIIFLKILLVGLILLWFLPKASEDDLHFDISFVWFVLAGFLAQIVDGALGLGYGVTSNSVLLWFGLSPKIASAAVHTAEVFTTGVSGLSHIKFGNFDRKLFGKLVLPGVISACIGAYLLSEAFNTAWIKPFITVYLLFLGVLILLKAFKKRKAFSQPQGIPKNAPLYAAFGGFMDAIGGGGWGPIVSSNLIKEGVTPSKVIGTVNTTEFFVTFFTSGILLYYSGIKSWQVILGLMAGGIVAAPIGAYLTKKLPRDRMLIFVGFLIIITSMLSLYKLFF